MKKKSHFIIAASTLNTIAGLHTISNEIAPNATGFGLLSIAAASITNCLAGENIIPEKWKRKLGTCLIVANMIPVALGVASIINPDASTSAGLGQLALAGAAAVQCLDLFGVFNDKDKL